MLSLDFYYFTFSTYILMVGISFIISFVIFYQISKNDYNKIDLIYIYILNIFGFAIGSKLLSLIVNNREITIYNFINSGYSFIGGILGSLLIIAVYCKKYKLDLKNILSRFTVIYPLIYSISKIGCFLNGCCGGSIMNLNFPLQLIDSIIMLELFLILLLQFKKQNRLNLITFLIVFGIIRFFEDFFRDLRIVIIYNLTLYQLICIALVITGVFFFIQTIRNVEK